MLPNNNFDLALQRAIDEEKCDEIQNLVEQGANPDIQGKHGITALILAAKKNDVELATFILGYPVELYLEDENEMDASQYANSAISLAIENKRNALSLELLKILADEFMESEDKTVLALKLLHQGANPNAQYLSGRNENSALIFAVYDHNYTIVKKLLESFADTSIKNKDAKSAARIAFELQESEIFNLIISYSMYNFFLATELDEYRNFKSWRDITDYLKDVMQPEFNPKFLDNKNLKLLLKIIPPEEALAETLRQTLQAKDNPMPANENERKFSPIANVNDVLKFNQPWPQPSAEEALESSPPNSVNLKSILPISAGSAFSVVK